MFHIECVTHLIGSYVLLPLILFMVLLHIFCLIPRPHMLNMTDHGWSVLNMICQVSVPGLTEWARAQEVVHCIEKKKEKIKVIKKPI